MKEEYVKTNTYGEKEQDKIAREKREWYQGATMHVMGRGVRRSSIFKDAEDVALFWLVLKETMKKTPFTVYSYCLMTNHFHLLLKTEDKPIWIIMNRLMSNYAKGFNQKYGYSGHLFDSRYTSKLVEDDVYFLEASRYIHLNPVRAHMVREPLDYVDSSYRAYMQREKNEVLDLNRIYNLFQRDPVDGYRRFVEGVQSHAEQEILIQHDMKEDELWLPW